MMVPPNLGADKLEIHLLLVNTFVSNLHCGSLARHTRGLTAAQACSARSDETRFRATSSASRGQIHFLVLGSPFAQATELMAVFQRRVCCDLAIAELVRSIARKTN